ncbi:hypothetical protein AAFF_G00350790 [Aldrovandia affinis]|uniref:Claudin n=1 Tax=Aldrovandia affinis TaxID=143900 RepID=A0AAD7R5E4_9TELE|nr:hypothetical protein AAFF_G00350790 [Aldrovandia affinis]
MASSGMQILAFVLALLGVFGATVATLLPNWKVSADVGSNIITAISQMQGLWMDCTWYSTGMFSCTLKYSVLSLPAYLQTARTTMVLSCVLAALGLCLASLGLKCTRWGGGRRAKGRTAVAGGACFVLAGALCLVPASWFTNEVISSFLDASVPESSKFEPGGAVYVAFVSAGLLFAGGSIFCTSCPGKREEGEGEGEGEREREREGAAAAGPAVPPRPTSPRSGSSTPTSHSSARSPPCTRSSSSSAGSPSTRGSSSTRSSCKRSSSTVDPCRLLLPRDRTAGPDGITAPAPPSKAVARGPFCPVIHGKMSDRAVT